jgi:gamma-glutamyltranspeptidase/glutathione hydrolase
MSRTETDPPEIDTRKATQARLVLTLLLAAALLLPQSILAASLPAVRGTGGAVASAHRLATEVGLETLRAGGNAADAAVATALALAVVFPEAGNLGGGGFAVLKMGRDTASLDFRETAPSKAAPDMYLDEAGEPVPEASLVGPLAAGVPGSPAGLWELHRRFGKLPWEQVVTPAIRLAAEGFPVDPHLHEVIAAKRDLLARFPETAATWLPGGEPPPVGSTLELPSLAETLELYARKGPKGIQRGRVAKAVVAASKTHGGILRRRDLARYGAVWRDPVQFSAYGWQVVSMGLPSSGGIILGEVMTILRLRRWERLPRFGARRIHFLAEAFRVAYADRTRLGDPATSEATAADILAPHWLVYRATRLDPRYAVPSDGIQPWSAEASRQVKESQDTTHLSVVDGEGNLVALTTTLNGLFGCGLWVPEAGFFLNNEMDDFAAAPGEPNLYGLVQGEANAVRPGMRMLSSMSPTVAWHGREALALGGRGGSMIPTNTAQVLLNILVDGDALQTAVNRPRVHHQWLPDVLRAEPDALTPETEVELRRGGYELEISESTAKIQAVRLLPDGRVEAAWDPRGPGSAGVVKEEPW